MKIFFPIPGCLSVRATVAAPSGDGSWASLEERLQKALDDGLNKARGKGGSVAVIFPDGSKWVGVSGVSHGFTKLTTRMRFSAGSIEKIFAAAAILRLAEEGMLAVDDTLDKWLPPYPYVDSTITIRQLLHHTSGLFMFWDNQKIWDDPIKYRDKIFTPEEVLTYLKEPYFPPGKGWHYSNTNYLLLAMIIKKATIVATKPSSDGF